MGRPVAELEQVVAAELRARRKALGLTQAAVGGLAGVSTELVSRIERGRCLPSVPTLVSLAAALSCTPNDLLRAGRARGPRELAHLVDLVRALPPSRMRDAVRVVEALARYQRTPR